MNKSDLIKLTSKKSGMSKSETTGVINSMIEVIGEAIQNGDKVNVAGFISCENDKIKFTKWFLDFYLKKHKIS